MKIEGVRLKTELENGRERQPRGRAWGREDRRGRGQPLRQKWSGRASLWAVPDLLISLGGEEGPLHSLGDGDGHRVCGQPQPWVALPILPSSFPPPGLQDCLSPRAGVGVGTRGIDKSQLQMGRGTAQHRVPVQEAGAAATVGGSSKPTAECDKAWVIFFPVCWHVGGFFLLFSSLLLSAVSTEMWEFANLSQWRGKARADFGGPCQGPGERRRALQFWQQKKQEPFPGGIPGAKKALTFSFCLEAAGMPSHLSSALGSQIHPTW